jgi:hypothetical protein
MNGLVYLYEPNYAGDSNGAADHRAAGDRVPVIASMGQCG